MIRELIDTETNYLEVLMALKKKFMQPMEAVLTKDEIRIIFPRIKVRTRNRRIEFTTEQIETLTNN